MKLVKATIIALLMVALMLGGATTASAQTALPAPTNVAAANGVNPGEVNLTWDAVAGANYYRIGWVAYADYQAATAAGRDWLEAFAFVDVANRGQTAHTVTRLTPGAFYAFIVASNDQRYGAPQWSEWATLTLKTDTAVPDVSQPTPTTGETTLIIPSPPDRDCYVGLQMRPGDSCNWPHHKDVNVSNGTWSISNGGDYHGQPIWVQVEGDILVTSAGRDTVSYSIGLVVGGTTRYRFSADRSEGNVWTVTKVNEPFQV